MSQRRATSKTPDWDALYGIAAAQAGHFTTAQAASAGYSPQLLHKHLASRRIYRVRRGVYRITHFPASEHEDLVVLWLWAEQAGIFSHQTSLALHDLSDVLPARAYMTLPEDWRSRRLRIPAGLVLHFAEVEDRDCEWLDAVPITSPRRTLRDCIDAHVSPDLVQQALRQARQRGLVSKAAGGKLTKRLARSMRETR